MTRTVARDARGDAQSRGGEPARGGAVEVELARVAREEAQRARAREPRPEREDERAQVLRAPAPPPRAEDAHALQVDEHELTGALLFEQVAEIEVAVMEARAMESGEEVRELVEACADGGRLTRELLFERSRMDDLLQRDPGAGIRRADGEYARDAEAGAREEERVPRFAERGARGGGRSSAAPRVRCVLLHDAGEAGGQLGAEAPLARGRAQHRTCRRQPRPAARRDPGGREQRALGSLPRGLGEGEELARDPRGAAREIHAPDLTEGLPRRASAVFLLRAPSPAMSPRLRSVLALACGLAAWALAALLLARFLFGTALDPGEPLRGGWTPLGALAAAGGLLLALLGRALFRKSGDGEPEGAPLALSRRAERALTALALALHALLATALSWELPLFEGPDESTHFDYARHVAREGALPALHTDGRSEEREVAIDQKIQPPLYYLLLAPALRALGATHWSTFYRLAPAREARDWPEHWDASKYLHGPDELEPYAGDVLALHLLRLTGIAFTLAALLGLRRALRALRVPRATVCATVAVLALLPQLAHLAGVFSNDLPAIAAGAWSAALALRFARRGALRPRCAVLLGALLGATCLSKLSGFVLLAWMGCVGIAQLVRHAKLRALLATSALALLGFALASGWYWVGNALEYGHPLQNWVYQQHYQASGDLGLDAWTHWAVLLPGTFGLSFFCDLGWMAAWPEPPALFALAFGLAPLAVALLSRRGLEACFARAMTPRLLVLLLFLLAWIAQLRFYAAVFQPQGRHHFPFLIAYALPLACALEALRFDLGRRAARIAHLALPAAMALFALNAWREVLREQFHPLNRAATPHLAITDHHARGALDAEIAIVEPQDDLRTAKPPVLRWRAEPGARYSVEIGLDGTLEGPSWNTSRRVVRTFEDLGLELEGDSFAIPPDAWEALCPLDRPVLWRVRRLTPVRSGPLAASLPRRLTRIDW